MSRGVSTPKPPLKWTAVLFALAANMLLVTLTNSLVQTQRWPPELEVLATLAAPVLVGIMTAFYARGRGAMHAFIGGMLSILPLGIFVFNGTWQLAIYAGCFCALGGALTEVITRRKSTQ